MKTSASCESVQRISEGRARIEFWQMFQSRMDVIENFKTKKTKECHAFTPQTLVNPKLFNCKCFIKS